jgi:hypothetical protein
MEAQMKNLMIATATLVLSTSAFALNVNSTWEEINASYKTDVKAPQVFFTTGEATTAYSIFETCVAGDKINTVEPKDVYVQVRHGNHEAAELVVVGQEILSHDKTYTIMINQGGKNGNQRQVPVVVTIPTVNQIDVFAKNPSANHGNMDQVKLFTKTFVIPACK